MTQDLTRRDTASLNEMMTWSRAMSEGNLLPAQYRGKPANLLFACEYADALGISRINAITSIHVIEGKPSASADLIAGLVRRAGHKLWITGDDTYAEATLVRSDDPDERHPFVVRWDINRARQAGLANKGTWKSYPAAMLRSRAITEVARMGASEALLGVIYTPEELGAEVSIDGEPVNPAPLGAGSIGRDVAPRRSAPDVAQEAEVIVDTHAVADDDEPRITAEQKRTLWPLMQARGLTETVTALAFYGTNLGRSVPGTADLSVSEAQYLIQLLSDVDEPAQEAEVVDAVPVDADDVVEAEQGTLAVDGDDA